MERDTVGVEVESEEEDAEVDRIERRRDELFRMRLTPAQEVALWRIDRLRMGDRTEEGRAGWVRRIHFHTNTLKALRRLGLLEFSPPDQFGQPRFLVRLTEDGNLRVPSL